MPKKNLDYVSLLGKDSVVADGNIIVPSHLKIAGLVKMDIESAGKVVIAENGVVIGHIKADEVLIHGKVTGDVTAGDGLLIYQSAVVEGHVDASKAKVYGKVMGDVIVSGGLMIYETGFVNGKLVSRTLGLEEGAFCNSDMVVGEEALSIHMLKGKKDDAKVTTVKRSKTEEISEDGKKSPDDTALTDTDKVEDLKVLENGEKNLKFDKTSKDQEKAETETDKRKHVLPKSKNDLLKDKNEESSKEKEDFRKDKGDMPKDKEWLDRFW